MSDISASNQQEFISGENLYFEYKGTAKVEVELNALDGDYPISRVIKQDANGDVIVQGMDHQSYINGNDMTNRGEIVKERFNHYQSSKGNQSNYYNDHNNIHNGNGNNNNDHHSHHSHHHSHMDSVGKQGDIIRDQINRSMNKNLLCDFEYADDLESMKEFWIGLPIAEKKHICQIESSEVMKVIQEDPKASCSCRVCGNRKVTLEKELQKLYIGYYSVRKLASESLDECELNINLVNNIFGIPAEKLIETSKSTIPPENDSAMNSIMSVADDLVKNNGENFINLIEQLHNSNRNQSGNEINRHELDSNQLHNLFQNPPEPQHFHEFTTHISNKIEELPNDIEEYEKKANPESIQPDTEVYDSELDEEGCEEEEEEEEDYEFDDQYQNESDQVTRKRLEETYKMLQLITSRVLRIKVYEAFKAKKADDISKSLLDEFAKEEEKLKEKEERHKKKKEKEKERKRLQRLAKEEEKKRLENEVLEMEKKELEEKQKKMEENKKRKETERKKREEEKKKKEEEKKKKKAVQLEKQRQEKEERDRKKKERQEELKLRQEKESKCKKTSMIKTELPVVEKQPTSNPQTSKFPTEISQVPQPPSILPFGNLPPIPPLVSSDQFPNFPDQNSMINSLMNSLPQSQPKYPFGEFGGAPSNVNPSWGINPLNDFQTNGMVSNVHSFPNNPINALYENPTMSPLSGNINPQTPVGITHNSSFMNDLFNPLSPPVPPPTSNRPHTTSMDHLYNGGNDIWNNGNSPSIASQQIPPPSGIDISPMKELNGLSSRQGSIWGSTPAPIIPPQNNTSWDTNAMPIFSMEMIQREALNASFKLPKLPNGGYSIQLLYRWVKQILDSSHPNLSLNQFIDALQIDMEGKVHANFSISQGSNLEEMVVMINQQQDPLLTGFSGISIIDNYNNGYPAKSHVWSSQL